MTLSNAVSPHSVNWQYENADGTKGAVIEGSRDEPARSFTYAFFIPGGVWDAPHLHSSDARIFVVQGELKIGFGALMDKSRAASLDVGSFLYVPAHAAHFDGADVDTVIFGVTSTPFNTEYIADPSDDAA